MPRDFLILQVRVAVSVERKVEKHGHFASAHVPHAELKVYERTLATDFTHL